MRTSPETDKLIPALLKAQSEMSPVFKDAVNPHFKAKFADLSSILGMVKPKLNANGILLTQATAWITEGTLLITKLTHTSGQWAESSYMVQAMKSDPQAFGSALSYAKRYSLTSFIGIETTDDDAEHAMDRPTISSQRETQPKVATSTMTTTPSPVQKQEPVAQSKWVAAVVAKSEPNHDPTGTYRAVFGKYKGVMLKECLVHDLENYCNWLKKNAADTNKPLSPNATEFILEVGKFLKTREPIPQPKDSSIIDDINKELSASAAQEFMNNEEIPF